MEKEVLSSARWRELAEEEVIRSQQGTPRAWLCKL